MTTGFGLPVTGMIQNPIAVTVNDLQRTEARRAVLHVGAEPSGLPVPEGL
jgi:hypothetical protein